MNVAHRIDGSCYGCGVCAIACPKGIIHMRLSDEGFYIPGITDEVQCLNCSLCEQVCSYLDQSGPAEPEDVQGFAVYSRNPEVRRACTSGGVGFEIARLLLGQGYRACGVRYNCQENRAEHFVADSLSKFEASRGSKYIQSFTPPGFSRLTREDKYVVFGTPCQIDSLRRWARRNKSEVHFVFVDFFCHGVPSYLLWHNYLKRMKQVCGVKNLDGVGFRDKQNGWHAFTLKIRGDREEHYSSLREGDLFYRFFLGNFCLNKPCYEACRYKHLRSAADVRIGDLWGKAYEKEEEGVSGVLACTETGRRIVEQLGNDCVVKAESVDVVTEGQMKTPLSVHRRRRLVLRRLKKGESLRLLLLKVRVWNKIEQYFGKLTTLLARR